MSLKLMTHATPTLFNAGTNYNQLASCFLLQSADSLDQIFKTISDCGQISKFAGGIGVGISDIRARNSIIKSTMGCCSSVNVARNPTKASPTIPKPINENTSDEAKSLSAPHMQPPSLKIDEKMRIDTPMPTEENYKSPGKDEEVKGALNQSKQGTASPAKKVNKNLQFFDISPKVVKKNKIYHITN